MVLPNSDYIKIIVGVDVVPYIHLTMKKSIREVIKASYLLKLRKVRACRVVRKTAGGKEKYQR